MAKAINDDICI
jgi:hypothetical protein